MHVLRELQWPSGAAAGACEDADWAPQTPAVRGNGSSDHAAMAVGLVRLASTGIHAGPVAGENVLGLQPGTMSLP